jgi:iron complex transport system substrate-binding protein
VKRPTISTLLAGLLWVGLIAQGCTQAPTPSPTAQPTVVPTGATVTDALGRTLHFAQPPQRIVVGGRNSLPVVETFYLFPEAAQRLAGMGGGNQQPGDFLRFIDPTFAQKAVLETGAGAEQISALQPDAVVMKSVNAQAVGKSLEALGIPVIYVELETPEQFTRDVAILGQLFGNPARTQEILSFYQARLQAVSEGLQGVTESARPRTLLVQYSEAGGEIALGVPSASWLQTVEVELAGGVAIWKEAAQAGGWNTVNLEQIAAWDPDTILVVSYSADSRQIVGKLRSDSRWQALKAVKEGRIYGFPADVFSWDQPDPRWILGVTWMASKLFPDRFRGLDMLEETADFFKQMYHMDRASFEANIVPRLRGDVR